MNILKILSEKLLCWKLIGNTIDMPRINKGDFILANIPVDLHEAIPFFTILIQVVNSFELNYIIIFFSCIISRSEPVKYCAEYTIFI